MSVHLIKVYGSEFLSYPLRQSETLSYKLFNIEYYTTLYLVMNGCSILKLKTATSVLSAMKLTLYLTSLSNVEK